MKVLKRILFGLLAIVVLVVAFALVAPLLFKDKIIENVKTSVNGTVNAKVDFADIDVSFLRSFPAISVNVDELSVVGIDTFAGFPLAKAAEASIDLDFWSVISGAETGNYVIESVELIQPEIRILVLEGNLANYDIAKAADPADSTTTTSSDMLFQLEKYRIENGYFEYDDRVTETYVEVKQLEHSGAGDFTLDVFDLDTKSTFGAFTLAQGGIKYIDEAEGELDAVLNIDVANAKYTFLDNQLRLNALELTADGSIALPAEDILFDLNVTAPANDFRQLWSMIPAAYTAGYDDVKTAGTFALTADIKGPYNGETPTYPSFNVGLRIDDGSVQYPGRPVAINGIAADVQVNSPSSDLNQLVVNVPNFRVNLGGDPFGGRFKLSNPISDPTVDARVEGTLDLAKWAQAMPLEDITELAGRIVADITLNNVRQSILESGRYDAVTMSGQANITDLVYATPGLPRVELSEARAEFTPRAVNIPDFQMKLGNSDLGGRASIDNILAYFSPDKTMRGTATVRSSYFDVDEWMPTETTELAPDATPAEVAAANSGTATSTSETEALFNRFDFTVDASADEIKYTSYRLKNSSVQGHVTANSLVVEDMSTTLGNTTLNGNGTIKNAWDYYFGDAVMGGQLDLRSEFVDVADFMEEEASAATPASTEESLAVIPVPENINVTTTLKADRVQYTDITLEEVTGDLVVRDQQVVIENGTTRLLGGNMAFAGAYDTSEPGDPGFRFHYDLKSLAFGSAFQQLNTFAALAPIGKFLEGQFNSDFVIEGKLGKDLYPILSSINARGFLQTIDASLASFKPLQRVGQALNVEELKQTVDLKEIKSWFQVEDGRVTVAPFDLKIAGIPMQIGGQHGLDMDMDYQIQAAVPRTLIEGNIITGTAIGALDQLAGQASRLGLNIQPGDTLNVGIGLTGTIADPKTKVDLLGLNATGGGSTIASAAQDRIKAEVGGKVDSVKGEARGLLNDGKTVVNNQLENTKDTLKTVADQTINQAKEQVGTTIRTAIGLGSDTTKKDSTTIKPAAEVKDAVEDIKKELTKFNPFKKKKKEGGGGED